MSIMGEVVLIIVVICGILVETLKSKVLYIELLMCVVSGCECVSLQHVCVII